MTLECVDVNHKAADGTATTPEAELYKAQAFIVDLKPEWLGQSFSMGGKQYKITGLKPRGSKCVLIESGGKTYVCTPEQVRVFFLAQQRKPGLVDVDAPATIG